MVIADQSYAQSYSLLLSYHKLYKSTPNPMFPEPRYLKLEEQLFPSITLYKELVFDNPQTGFHHEIFERVAYDSVDRTIDLTESVEHVLKKEYKEETELEIMVFDPLIQDYRFLAYFPVEANITLGEQFLQLDVLVFRVNPLPPFADSYQQMQAAPKIAPPNEEFQFTEIASGQEKAKRRKTIREMLEVIDKWRKICVHSNYKLSIQEGAAVMGISKRSLLFYIHNVKMGEKYQFDFENNLDKKISQLTSFVNEKNQMKKNEEMELLNKLKTYYK